MKGLDGASGHRGCAPPQGGGGRESPSRADAGAVVAWAGQGAGNSNQRRAMKKGFLQKNRTGTSQCRTSMESRGEKRQTRHEEDARTRDLAKRTPAAGGEAAADRGADGGDEAAAAGDGVNAGEHAVRAAMVKAYEGGAEAEGGGGACEAREPAKTTPRRERAAPGPSWDCSAERGSWPYNRPIATPTYTDT